MPERDGYIFGVPCWVDVSEPDPEAALDFYGGLFGWEFENVMPPGSEGKYFIGRGEGPGSSIFDTLRELRSGDVAAVGTIPEAAPATGMWNTYFWVGSADEAASKVRDAGGGIVVEPFDFLDACPGGRLHRCRGSGIPRLGGQAAQGCTARQASGQRESPRRPGAKPTRSSARRTCRTRSASTSRARCERARLDPGQDGRDRPRYGGFLPPVATKLTQSP
jgi:predicted enzyme related to lactoylglutathione lyase